MQLIRKFAKIAKESNDGRFRMVLQQEYADDSSLTPAEPVVAPQAEVVEGNGLASHVVGKPAGTRFTHFLDGTQDARRIGYYSQTVPIVYGFIAAVIRERKSDRRMYTYDKVSSENLYGSESRIDPNDLNLMRSNFKNVKEDQKDSGSPDIHPMRLLELARRAVSNDRAALERDLAKSWITNRSSVDSWLMWDGSITGSTETSKHPNVVGVIKSHQTQYFSNEEQQKILTLKVGERSSVFQPRGKDWTPVYSWYLRLHPNEGRDVYFGLIRIEAAATPETIAMADEISRWLLAERAPLSLPDSRWDRMIYPIRDCEQYLRSIAPSKTAIEASLAGL